MSGAITIILDVLSRGNVLEGLSALNDQPFSDPLTIVNKVLYSHSSGSSPIIHQEKTRHLKLLSKAENGDKSILLYNLGCFSILEDEVMEAKGFFMKTLETDPAFTPAMHNLAYTHELMAEYDEALELYNGCLAQDPAYTLSRINRNLLLAHQGDAKGALDDFFKMVEEYPMNTGVLFYLCQTLLRQNTPQAAEKALEILAQHGGWEKFPRMEEIKAYALFLKGEKDSAKKAFESILENDENNQTAWLGLIKTYAQTMEFEAMANAARHYHSLAPTPYSEALVASLKKAGYLSL
ncbi:MAG: tetratricopeptide repeat protein [Deltaproteobacteria bacterium]|nr:tetratricopeptide repeat protein [Deltaproteobacteria bacterium]